MWSLYFGRESFFRVLTNLNRYGNRNGTMADGFQSRIRNRTITGILQSWNTNRNDDRNTCWMIQSTIHLYPNELRECRNNYRLGALDQTRSSKMVNGTRIAITAFIKFPPLEFTTVSWFVAKSSPDELNVTWIWNTEDKLSKVRWNLLRESLIISWAKGWDGMMKGQTRDFSTPLPSGLSLLSYSSLYSD